MKFLKFSSGSIKFSLGEEEIVATREFLRSKDLNYFPDGTLGIFKEDATTVIFASNNAIARLEGFFDAPFRQVESNITLEKPKQIYNYVGGGPVYFDEPSDTLLLFYHAERHPRGIKKFYSTLGITYSRDLGHHFFDLGEFILPYITLKEASGKQIEVSGGAVVPHHKYLYVYYTDHAKTGERGLAVARAESADVIISAQQGNLSEWKKYYNGHFSEPGLGGNFTPLLQSQELTWPHIIYNSYLKKFILIYTTAKKLFLRFSLDGLVWENPTIVVAGSKNSKEEFFYPTLISPKNDPVFIAGKELWIYYTHSKIGGWHRWEDAQWVRRKIIFK